MNILIINGPNLNLLGKRESIYNGIVLNPGALAHYSYSLKDAIRSINTPVIELHLTDIKQRENFRKISVIEEDCVLTIIGDGKKGYLKAINYFLNSKK